MASTTEKCLLKLPDTGEYYSVNILNSNFRALDEAVISIYNAINETERNLNETIKKVIGGELEGDYSSIVEIVEKLKNETEFIQGIEKDNVPSLNQKQLGYAVNDIAKLNLNYKTENERN